MHDSEENWVTELAEERDLDQRFDKARKAKQLHQCSFDRMEEARRAYDEAKEDESHMRGLAVEAEREVEKWPE
jgi:hypothetical protein